MSQISQQVRFRASPDRVYRALIDSSEFEKVTGAPATLSSEAGSAFACFGARIVGRNIELVPNKRIVQAWRPASWPEGAYSIARFELSSEGESTLLAFEQDGVPEDSREHIEAGWARMYWEPLRKYLER